MSESRTLVVLGMHRSGTSCIAGCLSAGLGMGVGEPLLWGPDNPAGHHEDPDLVTLNEELLAACGTSWRKPPTVLSWTEDLIARRNALVGRWFARSDWHIIKDPRLAVLWPFWADVMANVPVLATYRHPGAVLDSFATRHDPISREEVLRLWIASNQTVLEVAALKRVPLTCFDRHAPPYLDQLRAALTRWRELGWAEVAASVNLELAAAAVSSDAMHHDESGWGRADLCPELVHEAEEVLAALDAICILPFSRRSSVEHATRSSDWRSLLAEAFAAPPKSEWVEVLQAFETAAAVAPDPDAVWRHAVESALQRGRSEEALGIVSRMQALRPSTWWRMLEARCLMSLGKLEAALSLLDVLASERPLLIQVYRLRLELLARMGLWRRLLEVSGPVTNDNAPWVRDRWRGIALLHAGCREAAIECHANACAGAGSDVSLELRVQWAEALAATGSLDEAEQEYNALLASPEPPLLALISYANLKYAAGEREAALQFAETACGAYPDDAWPQWTACLMALGLADLGVAQEHCSRAALLAPEHPETVRLTDELARVKAPPASSGRRG